MQRPRGCRHAAGPRTQPQPRTPCTSALARTPRAAAGPSSAALPLLPGRWPPCAQARHEAAASVPTLRCHRLLLPAMCHAAHSDDAAPAAGDTPPCPRASLPRAGGRYPVQTRGLRPMVHRDCMGTPAACQDNCKSPGPASQLRSGTVLMGRDTKHPRTPAHPYTRYRGHGNQCGVWFSGLARAVAMAPERCWHCTMQPQHGTACKRA